METQRHPPMGGRDIKHVATANSNLNHYQQQQQQQPQRQQTYQQQQLQANPASAMTSGREKRTLGDNSKTYPPAKKIQQDRNTVVDDGDMFPDDDDDIFPDDDGNIFPDDDEDILLMADMSVVETGTTEVKQEPVQRPVKSRSPVIPPPPAASTSSSSSTLMRSSTVVKPVQQTSMAVRPFTYLSAHLRRRMANGDLASSTVCVKVIIGCLFDLIRFHFFSQSL